MEEVGLDAIMIRLSCSSETGESCSIRVPTKTFSTAGKSVWSPKFFLIVSTLSLKKLLSAIAACSLLMSGKTGGVDFFPRRSLTTENILRESVPASSRTFWTCLDFACLISCEHLFLAFWNNCLSTSRPLLLQRFSAERRAILAFRTDGVHQAESGLSTTNLTVNGAYVSSNEERVLLYMRTSCSTSSGGEFTKSDIERLLRNEFISIFLKFLAWIFFFGALGLAIFVVNFIRKWSDMRRSSTLIDWTNISLSDLDTTQSKIWPPRWVGWETCWTRSAESNSCTRRRVCLLSGSSQWKLKSPRMRRFLLLIEDTSSPKSSWNIVSLSLFAAEGGGL